MSAQFGPLVGAISIIGIWSSSENVGAPMLLNIVSGLNGRSFRNGSISCLTGPMWAPIGSPDGGQLCRFDALLYINRMFRGRFRFNYFHSNKRCYFIWYDQQLSHINTLCSIWTTHENIIFPVGVCVLITFLELMNWSLAFLSILCLSLCIKFMFDFCLSGT